MKIIGLFFIALGAYSNAFATSITYSGVITELTGSVASSTLFGLAETGDTIVGNFSYNPMGVADAYPADDTVGSYNFNASNSSFSLTLLDSSNSNSVLYQYFGRIAYILTQNNWIYTPNPSLYPTIDAFTPVGLLDNGSLVYLRYQNRDTNLDLISTDALPTHPLSFDSFNYHTGSISPPSGYTGQISFDLTSLSALPSPPTPALLVIGLLFIHFRRKLKNITLTSALNPFAIRSLRPPQAAAL